MTLTKTELKFTLSMLFCSVWKMLTCSIRDSSTAGYDEGELVYVEHRDETVPLKRELEVEVQLGARL